MWERKKILVRNISLFQNVLPFKYKSHQRQVMLPRTSACHKMYEINNKFTSFIVKAPVHALKNWSEKAIIILEIFPTYI